MKIKNFKQLSIYIFLFLIQFAIFAQEQNSSETNSTGSSLSKEQAAEILKKHNEFRKKTSSSIPDLTWSTEISTYSQKWAEHLKLTKKCGLEHRKGKKKVHKYGENLFAMYGASASPEKVVTAWYDEVKDYTYSTNSCNPGEVCGHYTQVVWAKSTSLGCGVAKCARGEVWVCNYNPPGNYNRQKPY